MGPTKIDNFDKRVRGFDWISCFRGGLLGKGGGGDLFQEGLQFLYKKNENLKYLMTKKVYRQKRFSLSEFKLEYFS